MLDVNELILNNKGLVYKQLHRFYLINDPEAESQAFWALHNAIVTYREADGVLLSTYATCCIYNALGCYVRKMHNKRQLDTVSYNAQLYESIEMLDTLPDPTTTEDTVLRTELVMITRKTISSIYANTASDLQKSVLRLYIDSDYNMTATSIAKSVGVSQSYVSQILSEFRNKLKKKMEAYYNE